MNQQNVTISIPINLLKQAKILAINNDKSLSQLIKEALEEKVTLNNQYQLAMEKQEKLFAKGLNLGTNGQITHKRSELYERT